MINRRYAKLFCCEDISLIENYDKAKMDLFETWHLHHRKEDEGYSRQELIDKGMYYKRPASELIFLTRSEHASLHSKGNKYWVGKKHSEEAKKKISEANKGEKNPRYGLIGEKNPTSKPIQQIDKQTGNVIKIWPCAVEVERIIGINPSSISQCCLGKRKSAGGYVWRHAS